MQKLAKIWLVGAVVTASFLALTLLFIAFNGEYGLKDARRAMYLWSDAALRGSGAEFVSYMPVGVQTVSAGSIEHADHSPNGIADHSRAFTVYFLADTLPFCFWLSGSLLSMFSVSFGVVLLLNRFGPARDAAEQPEEIQT